MAKTILVVDDDAVSRELVKRRLADSGYNLITADNGTQALNVIQKTPPDLILLDIQMPQMNGYAFITELRKIEAQKTTPERIPIIVLTAHDKMEPIFKRHGASGYLLKPLEIDKLLQMVKEALV